MALSLLLVGCAQSQPTNPRQEYQPAVGGGCGVTSPDPQTQESLTQLPMIVRM